MSSSEDLLHKVVELINDAKLESKDKKTYLLTQVQEICLNRDTSLLPKVIPMVADFQTDFNAGARKFVVSFLRETVKLHPEHVALAVPVANYLLNDDNANVKKSAVLLANTIYRPALQHLVTHWGESSESGQKDWTALETLRKNVLQLVTTGPPDMSMVAIKFAETFVLACVSGRSLGPGSSREGDKSVQRHLNPSHPFLRADALDEAGRALARQMVGWLQSGLRASSGDEEGDSGVWGPGFVAQHYTVLVGTLQKLATNKAALFSSIVPALAAALEGATGAPSAPGGGSTGVPKGLRGAASSLRSACLKLLKVAPGPVAGVQRMADAAARAGSDDEAKAAVDGNSALRGRIRVLKSGRSQSVRSLRVLPATSENRSMVAGMALSSLCRLPRPPPGHSNHQTEGLPLSTEALVGYILNTLGPDIAAGPLQQPKQPPTHPPPPPPGARKRARSPTEGEEGPKRRASTAQEREGAPAASPASPSPVSVEASPSGTDSALSTVPEQTGRAQEGKMEAMDVDEENSSGDGGGSGGEASNGGAEAEEKLPPPPLPPPPLRDPALVALELANKAFRRVVGGWNGVVTEGKRDLHQRLMSRVARILAEGEEALEGRGVLKKEDKEMPEAISEVVSLVTSDYRRCFEAALALLTEIYVANSSVKPTVSEVSTLTVPNSTTSYVVKQEQENSENGGKEREESEEKDDSDPDSRRFHLYDTTLVYLLGRLTLSLETSSRQKLFVQTLLACPRVPQGALELVFSLCELAASKHEVYTGMYSLMELILFKPAIRSKCLASALKFTSHQDIDVRTKAVRLCTNKLWPDHNFKHAVETYAKQALASLKPPPETKEEKVTPTGQAVATPAEVGGKSAPTKVGYWKYGSTSSEAAGKKSTHTGKTPHCHSHSSPPFQDTLNVAEVRPRPTTSATPSAEGPWTGPPETEEATRLRLALYFALCVKSRAMLTGLLEAYSTALPPAQRGIMAELEMLVPAAAKGFGETKVVEMIAKASKASKGAKALELAMLDRLVPKQENSPSPELVEAVKRLRDTRLESAGSAGGGNSGIAYLVPVLAGFGKDGILDLLPQILMADDETMRAAFRRLTYPPKVAPYTPAEMVVLLNRFATNLTVKHLIEALKKALILCLENKAVYNYAVLREAINTMSQPAGENGSSSQSAEHLQYPLLMMWTMIKSITTFPELKNFVATTVLPRLVRQKVWLQKGVWKGFLHCAYMMARESGATSFIALVQLPAEQLKAALAMPRMTDVRDPLRTYAESLVKVDPGVRAVLGM
ncbi:unnamed protein product [Discosporangium mesarthrocarpum]